MKAEVTNTSRANQGVWTPDGLVWIEPGKTRELDIAEDYVARVQSLPFLTIKEDGEAGPDDLDGMKAPALRKLAEAEDVDLSGITHRDDVIAAIRAKRAGPAEDTRSDEELRAAVIEQLGPEGAADLDRVAMLALLSPAA